MQEHEETMREVTVAMGVMGTAQAVETVSVGYCGKCHVAGFLRCQTHILDFPVIVTISHRLDGCFVLFCFVLFCFVLFCLFFPGS